MKNVPICGCQKLDPMVRQHLTYKSIFVKMRQFTLHKIKLKFWSNKKVHRFLSMENVTNGNGIIPA